jgi:hypothetical protein
LSLICFSLMALSSSRAMSALPPLLMACMDDFRSMGLLSSNCNKQ